MHHVRHQSPFRCPRSTNVGHKPSQVCSTLDGFGSCDIQVFAKAKPTIQLHPQVLDTCFPLDLMLSENDPWVLEKSPVRDQQSLGFLRGNFQASAIQPTLYLPQNFIDPRLQDSDVLSGAHDKCVIHDVPNEWTHSRPLRGATCHIFFERPFVTLVYHLPFAQIVIYHSQQVVWNRFLHHRLDADIPLRGIQRIAYVNADNAQNPLRLPVPFHAFVAMLTTSWIASAVNARCFRCFGCGHGNRGCGSPDRKNACLRCGTTGHLARSCKAPPRCLACLDRGAKDIAHVSGGGSCPVFREELRRLRGPNDHFEVFETQILLLEVSLSDIKLYKIVGLYKVYFIR